VRRPSAQLQTAPEVRQAADRLTAQNALPGVSTYPLVVLTVGVVADLYARRPYLFALVLAASLALAVCRIVLIRRFPTIYPPRPRFWRRAFYGSVLGNALLLGGLFFVATRSFGPRGESYFLFATAAVISSLGAMLFAHEPKVVFAFVVVLNLPVLLALTGLTDRAAWRPAGWEGLWVLVFFFYLFGLAAQFYKERWAGLTSSHLLALRAAELERAQAELRGAHDELARLVEERAQELRKASEDYRRIFENAHDAILILDPEDETVLNVNPRACEIYGFPREEFLGMSIQSLSENVERGRHQIAQTMEQGVFYNFETVQYRKDGSRMFLEINASLVEYEGRPALLSINRDVTERRRSEELRLAKEAAEQADQAKGRFLANMSHEIRTPMAGVLGLVDLLLKTDLSSQQRDYSTLIQSSAASLLRLIDDILDFSRIEAGQLLLERERFDLHATLHEIIELQRFRASAQGTELGLMIGLGVPVWVWGDPGRLRQVLTNLVGNAVKFTESGEIGVVVSKLPDGRYQFRIHDTGIGIPEAAQGRLFGLFSQADSSTSRRYGGSGLGLAISQRLVQQMGGEIGFESHLGEGSLFWFTLPLDTASAPTAPVPLVRPESVPRPDGRRHRILVAEDNLVNQLVITQQLTALGYDALAVNNGREALEALARTPVDLILMDCQMPEIDGYEATRRIRESAGESRTIPIVALTAHAMKEDLERCLAVGMNDYITKPFREDVLQRKLAHWLTGGKETPPPSAPAPRVEGEIPVLSTERMAELRELGRALGRDVLRELAESFRSQTCMEGIRTGLAEGDLPLVEREAHTLKGSSAALGAMRLADLCAKLEHQPPETAEGYVPRVAAIEEEYRRVLEGLTAASGPHPLQSSS